MHGPAVPLSATKPSLYDGDLTTLAAGLHRFGRLPPHSGKTQFANNCVSVAIARSLAYSDFHEFWQDTLGRDLADTPLSVEETVSLIAKTGWKCKWTIYLPRDGESAFRNMLRDPHFSLHSHRAVAYSREPGVGHCVASGAANIGRVGDSDFVCYQRDRYGVDLSHEVQAADRIFVFHMGCEHYSPQWCSWIDRQTRRMLERRRDPVWNAQKRELIESALKSLGMGPNQHAETGGRTGAGGGVGKQRRASACGKSRTSSPDEGGFGAKPQKSLVFTERLLLALASTLAFLFVAVVARVTA